jgi:hypothetical protein
MVSMMILIFFAYNHFLKCCTGHDNAQRNNRFRWPHLTKHSSFLFLTLSFSACSQYGKITPDALSRPTVVIDLPENYFATYEKIEQYLKSRGHFEKVIFNQLRDGQNAHFISRWVRDSSLRYYMLEFDSRERHLSEWKAQWTLEGRGRNNSKLTVTVLEVIYMGPPYRAGVRPEAPQDSLKINNIDWYETTEDNLRAAIEARRFWTSLYPTHALPKILANVPIISLEVLPNSEALLKNRWKPLQRQRSF